MYPQVPQRFVHFIFVNSNVDYPVLTVNLGLTKFTSFSVTVFGLSGYLR